MTGITPRPLAVAAGMFERAAGHLDESIETFAKIVETNEVQLLNRTKMGQQVRVDDLPAAYTSLFRHAAAAETLVDDAIVTAGSVLPEAMTAPMLDHLEQMRRNLITIDQYRAYQHVRKTGTVGMDVNGLALVRGDAESAALLLRALDGAA